MNIMQNRISNDVTLFSEVGLTLVHHYRVQYPAFVSPIMDQYAEGEMPPTEYHPPELPPDLCMMPVGPGMVVV